MLLELSVTSPTNPPPSPAQDSYRSESNSSATLREHSNGSGPSLPDSHQLGRRGQSDHHADSASVVPETLPESLPDGTHL